MTLTLEKNALQKAVADLRFRTQAFIGGKFVDSISGKTFASENPATGKNITHIAACDEKDVDLAVKIARKTFDEGGWSRMPPANRKKILLNLADLIEKHDAELDALGLPGGRKAHRRLHQPRFARHACCFPLACRGHRQAIRTGLAHWAGTRRADNSGTNRRGRGGNSLEFPAADGGLEVGPGPGNRQ